MSKYPDVITPECAEKNKGISDEDIREDIADTEHEIAQMKKDAYALDILSESARESGDHIQQRVRSFRRDANTDGITRRKEFVIFLKKLLEYRKQESGEK